MCVWSVSVNVFVSLPLGLSLSLCRSVYLHVFCASIRPFVCLSVCLSGCLPVCLSVCLSVRLSQQSVRQSLLENNFCSSSMASHKWWAACKSLSKDMQAMHLSAFEVAGKSTVFAQARCTPPWAATSSHHHVFALLEIKAQDSVTPQMQDLRNPCYTQEHPRQLHHHPLPVNSSTEFPKSSQTGTPKP